jgi:hypothetical protein
MLRLALFMVFSLSREEYERDGYDDGSERDHDRQDLNANLDVAVLALLFAAGLFLNVEQHPYRPFQIVKPGACPHSLHLDCGAIFVRVAEHLFKRGDSFPGRLGHI